MEVQHGQDRSKKVAEASRRNQSAGLKDVAVLPKSKWLRIQDEVNHINRDAERIREATNRRKALHQLSKDMVKLWPDTIVAQRKKRLEAKTLREENEEEEKRLIDLEEANYQEQKRRELMERAKTQLSYQTDRVRGLHRALMMTEVLKEREEQIEVKKKMQSSCKNAEKELLEMMKCRHEEALRKDKEKEMKKKLKTLAVAEELKKQIDDNELKRLQLKRDKRKEGEELQHWLVDDTQQQRQMEYEKVVHRRRLLMQDHMEDLANIDNMREAVMDKLEEEEERRELFVAAKDQSVKSWKERKADLFMEGQLIREVVADKLSLTQNGTLALEEERHVRAIAEADAKEAQRQKLKEEKKAAELKSIAAHREAVIQEKKRRERMAHQSELEVGEADKEANRMYTVDEKGKADKSRQKRIASLDYCANLRAEKSAGREHLRKTDRDLSMQHAELLVFEENAFDKYSRQIIKTAEDAEQNVFPLCKAAFEGTGGGLGPLIGGVRPSYLEQDDIGAQLLRDARETSQNIKEPDEVEDIEKTRKQVRFILDNKPL
ncbi:cilia- and flagella- associated protein 210-like [Genypterus blacodes]|uniref:cilia- and flagella- associated protein 210-like n=1 Tax=Genypterus blacodes TaxID=154954 RepID=UPI003F76B89E